MTTEAERKLVAAQRELTGAMFRIVFELSGLLGAVAWVVDTAWGVGFTCFAVGLLAAFGTVYLTLRKLERS